MKDKFIVSSSPHFRSNGTTQNIMGDVIISMLPAVLFGVYFFGVSAALIIIVTVLSCVLAEHISRKVMKRENTISDLSAVVTGILLALNLPPTIPLWIAAVGGIISIVVVKQFFGGIGYNFMNPALASRVILLISWPVAMTTWVKPGVDAISSATPLGIIKEGTGEALPSLFELFIGNIGGCIGETSVLALLLGGIYLLARRIITIEIPLYYIATLGLFVFIFENDQLFTGNFIFHILSGGLILGAFFMATDYTTSPMTKKGKIIFAIGCGLFTAIIRMYTNYPEGVSFAILFMNILVPLIDRYTVPKSYGGERKVA